MKNLIIGTTILSATLMTQVACQKKNTSSSGVTTSVTMSSSSKAAGVAANKYQVPLLEKIMGKIIPTSIANPAPASLSDAATTPNTLTLTNFWVVIKGIEFKSAQTAAQEGADDADEKAFNGPYFVDMLSSNPTPLDTKSIADKVYHRVKLQLEAAGGNAALPTGAPSQLASNSIYLTGSINGNAFSYLSDDGTEVDIAGGTGVSGSNNQNLLISIRIGDIVKKIDFTTLSSAANKNIDHTNRVAGTNLCPLISSSAPDYYTCFRKALETEADMGHDLNGEIDNSQPHVK